MIAKNPTFTFVCYLFKENENDINKLFKLVKGQSVINEYDPIEVKNDNFNNIQGFIKKTEPKEPKWTKKLKTVFNFPKIENQSNSFLFFITVKNRTFAFTMGYSYHSINKSKIVQDFGIKIAANELDMYSIKAIDARRLDYNAKLKRETTPNNDFMSSFDFDKNMELLHSLSGTTDKSTFSKSLIGKDSLKVITELNLDLINDFCINLLDSYNKTNFKTNGFDFIENLKIIDFDEEIKVAHEKLKERIVNKDKSLTLIQPSADYYDIDSYTIEYKNYNKKIDELNLDTLLLFLEQNNLRNNELNLKDLYININLGNKDEPVKQSIIELSYFEYFIKENKKYIFTDNKLYHVKTSYYKIIDKDLEEYITKELKDLNVIAFNHKNEKGELSEGIYNDDFSIKNSHIVINLDKQNFKNIPNRPYDKIEICDILTKNKEFICIKRYKNSSQSLSHLLSQCIVSCELLINEKKYRDIINKSFYNVHSIGLFDDLDNINKNEITYIYGIISKKEILDLPFFSKIALRQSIKNIVSSGIKVKVLKIDNNS
ncbi:DUF6119 family protein [Arcobacter sp. YIC-80]|uniref:DUF6119 family protein n=1 Tax=Arcobacter sp. YIC-80 TaxID=3376683 RepID=UPI00384E5D4E